MYRFIVLERVYIFVPIIIYGPIDQYRMEMIKYALFGQFSIVIMLFHIFLASIIIMMCRMLVSISNCCFKNWLKHGMVKLVSHDRSIMHKQSFLKKKNFNSDGRCMMVCNKIFDLSFRPDRSASAPIQTKNGNWQNSHRSFIGKMPIE